MTVLLPLPVAWYHSGTKIIDRYGRLHWLNGARPVTRWRRLRAWIGWFENDTLRWMTPCPPVI